MTDMAYMFWEVTNFNQPLNDWNMGSVNNMAYMFDRATNFNQPLDDWDVSSIYDILRMFNGATNFNQCLSSWASKVPTDIFLRDMFYGTSCPNTEPVTSVAPWCTVF